MSIRLLLSAVVGLGLLLSGCASLPKADLSGPTATLAFAKGYQSMQRFGRGANAVHAFYADNECKSGGRVVFSWATPDEQVRMAPAGRPIFLQGTTSLFWSDGRYMHSKTCEGFAGFVPEPGQRYSVVIRASERGCVLEIRDTATGQPPPTARFFDRLDQCPAFMRLPPPPVLRLRPAPAPTAAVEKT